MRNLLSNDPLAVSVCLRYSWLSSSWGPPYFETSPAFIMLISWVWSGLRPPTKLPPFKTVWNDSQETMKITQELVIKRKVHSVIQPPFLAKYSIGIQKYAGGKGDFSSFGSFGELHFFLWLSDAELKPQVTNWKPLSCFCHETHFWNNSFCTVLAP